MYDPYIIFCYKIRFLIWWKFALIKRTAEKKVCVEKCKQMLLTHLDLSVFFYTLFFPAVCFIRANFKPLITNNCLEPAVLKRTAEKKSV